MNLNLPMTPGGGTTPMGSFRLVWGRWLIYLPPYFRLAVRKTEERWSHLHFFASQDKCQQLRFMKD